MLIVPFTSDYDQEFVVALGDVKYTIDARWNERAKVWNFDLTGEDGTLLLSGVPLLSGHDVLAPYGLGIGGLLVTDLSSSNSDAGPDDLADRVIVTWLSPAEMVFLAGAGVPGVPNSGPIPPTPGTGGTGGATPSGGGGAGTSAQTAGAQFSEMRDYPDSSGNEQLSMQFVWRAGANPNALVALAFGFLARSDLGTAVVRVYVGGLFGTLGSYGTPSGTLIGLANVSGATNLPYEIQSASPFVNPGGIIPVKVTLQSSSGTSEAAISTLQGVIG